VLKSAARSLFEEHCRAASDQRVTKSGAVHILDEVWNRFATEVIEAGWAIYGEDGSAYIEDEEDDPTWEID
jgi:hypothetical protein